MAGTSPLAVGEGLHLADGAREEAVARLAAPLPGRAMIATSSSASTGSTSKGVMPPRTRGEYQARSIALVERQQAVDLRRRSSSARSGLRDGRARPSRAWPRGRRSARRRCRASASSTDIDAGLGLEVEPVSQGWLSSSMASGVISMLTLASCAASGTVAHVDHLQACLGGDVAQGLQRVLAMRRHVDAEHADLDVLVPAHQPRGRAALVPQHLPHGVHALVELGGRGGLDERGCEQGGGHRGGGKGLPHRGCVSVRRQTESEGAYTPKFSDSSDEAGGCRKFPHPEPGAGCMRARWRGSGCKPRRPCTRRAEKRGAGKTGRQYRQLPRRHAQSGKEWAVFRGGLVNRGAPPKLAA